MKLQNNLNTTKAHLEDCRSMVNKEQWGQACCYLLYAVEELTRICKLLSSGIADIAEATQLLDARFDKEQTDT